MEKDFEVLSHTADLKIRAYGKTLEMLFKNALVGMFQSIGPKTHKHGCVVVDDRLVCKNLPAVHKIEIRSHDLEALLVDFLSEALYLSDVYAEAYLDAVITFFSDTCIKGIIKGISIDEFCAGEIKAVTHHDIKIKQKDDCWQAEILFDT